jgi:adenine-specific DNA-methyltransferase
MTQENFETALARVRDLVADFREHEAHYLSPKYQEQDVRKDFIDKFWSALGWDVNHETQKNPNEQEVKVERGVGVEGRVKRADYAFLTPNFRDVRFFVEAKKPARNIDNEDDYFQTIRYGWNAQCPASVLTDFAHLHVVDCRLKPDVRTARQRVLQKFHYTDYLDAERFAEIYYLFSREAAHAGALEKYAAALPKFTGKAVNRKLFGEAFKTVDEDFLQGLDELREELARSFKQRNEAMDGEELTEATQRTLDRLVFMRFLEDKLIEPEVIVERLGDGGSAWGDFVAQSARLNGIYNGIIFKPHFIDAADFTVDERVFETVRERLAHTNTVYNFNYIPIHVLGSIYERFLGKVIVADGKHARVEDKPEVRKADGVYYTPEYIVRYIVAETIGKLIAGKTPAEVSALRFADIACGSGSFLLGVFEELLRHHTAYYNRNKTTRAEGRRAGCVENTDGTLRLSLRQKKALLVANIYGVDLDAQAVEVAQLSLFLRLLEDETTASARGHQLEFRETMLPDLRHNIKHGNSLVGWDIGGSGGLFGDEEERRLYPLDFAQAFPEVMRRGGFDALVGNPPYRMLQPHNTSKTVINYLRKNYVAAEFKIELFHLFLQRGASLLKTGGKFGYIVPTTILNNVYAEKLRTWLMERTSLDLIAVARGRVFADADVHTCVLVFRRNGSDPGEAGSRVRTTDRLDEAFVNDARYNDAEQAWFSQLHGNVWNILINEKNAALAFRLLNGFPRLCEVASINRGLVTGDKSKFFSAGKSSPAHAPILAGGDVMRFYTKPHSAYVLFERPQGAGGCWDREVHFAPHKIVVRQIGDEPTASLINDPLAVTANIFTIRAGELDREMYLLGLINSKLMTFFWKLMFSDFKTSFPQVTIFSLSQLPIRTLDLSDRADRARHDRMVSLVASMLDAQRKLHTARTDRDRDHYEAKCAALDHRIDALVYELYELTSEEVALVEQA